MKSLFASMGIMLGVMLAACAGNAAREHVGIPAMKLAGPEIKTEALRGADDLGDITVEAFFEAVASGDADRIVEAASMWPTVRAAAEADITARVAAGAIGPNVAESLRVRLQKFEDVLNQMIQG